MNSLLRPHGGGGVAFLQLWLELGWLVAAVVLAVRYHSALSSLSSLSVVASALVFALLMVGLNAAFGIYRRDRRLNFGEYAVRQSAAFALASSLVSPSVNASGMSGKRTSHQPFFWRSSS